jgi:hypothetical protein
VVFEAAKCLKPAARAAKNCGAVPAVHAAMSGSGICAARDAVLVLSLL